MRRKLVCHFMYDFFLEGGGAGEQGSKEKMTSEKCTHSKRIGEKWVLGINFG